MIRDVMIHLDGSSEDAIRLAHGESLAARFEAHLTGLYTNALPEYAYVLGIQSGLAPAGPVMELEERIHREGDAAMDALRQAGTRLSVPYDFRRIEAGLSELPGLCRSEARWADLFVATTPYRSENATGWDVLVETVLFEAGHGIYLIPPQCRPPRSIDNVLIAWQDTREATRAVAEALPLLAGTRVRLVTVDPPARSDRSEQAIDIATHLNRHGATVETFSAEAGTRSIAETLLDEAHRCSADLIVLGAYGHSRLREWILGGTTRDMIARSNVPLLMAH